MTEESIISAKKPDNFSTESPLRAFTDFQEYGVIGIGKGFRPSIGHLAAYLNAMEEKEGWCFAQIILPRDNDGDPTIIFHRMRNPQVIVDMGPPRTAEEGARIASLMDGMIGKADDPVNPKHYDGRACADIGERLSANGYQVLKYVWRLGKKDDPCVEIGKAIWYCESEIELVRSIAPNNIVHPNVWGLMDPDDFMEKRIADQPQFTQDIARMLWAGYHLGRLKAIHEALGEHRFHLDCGRGLAV